MDALSWFALAVILFVVVVLVYGIIAIHDIPYKIAKARNHPHQDAIQAGGWISLLTLHAIWPLLWIWAYSYDPRYGYAGHVSSDRTEDDDNRELEAMRRRVAGMESQLEALQASLPKPDNTQG